MHARQRTTTTAKIQLLSLYATLTRILDASRVSRRPVLRRRHIPDSRAAYQSNEPSVGVFCVELGRVETDVGTFVFKQEVRGRNRISSLSRIGSATGQLSVTLFL